MPDEIKVDAAAYDFDFDYVDKRKEWKEGGDRSDQPQATNADGVPIWQVTVRAFGRDGGEAVGEGIPRHSLRFSRPADDAGAASGQRCRAR